MSTFGAVKDTLGIVSDVANILSNPTVKKVGSAAAATAGVVKHISDTGSALTRITGQTMIMSRAFIDSSVLDEVVLPNLMRSFHEWYAAQIIAALQLSQMVDSGRSVQDVMRVLQTGDVDRSTSATANIIREGSAAAVYADKRWNQQYEFLSNYLGEAAVESFGPAEPGYSKKLRVENEKLEEENKQLKTNFSSASVRSVESSNHKLGPMGELFEVGLTNPGTGLSVKVPVFVQMRPMIVDAAVAPRFIDMNMSAEWRQRWMQWRAGEISFWHDFIWQRDNIQRQKAISKDAMASKAFAEFQRSISKKNKYALGDLTDRDAGAKSSNLANSVVVFHEDTVRQARSDSGIDIHNEKDRQRYFNTVYAMIVAVIDPLHQRVTIYFNGVDGALESSYNDFKPKGQSFDPKDFMQALSAFSTNSIGRLR